MKYPLERVWLLAFGVIVVVMCINGALAYKALADLARHQREVAGTLTDMNRVTSTYAALLNAEAGQRGLLLTGEAKYLEPFRQGVLDVNRLLDELSGSIDLPEQRVLVEQLRAAVEDKIQELEGLKQAMQTDSDGPIPLGLMSSQGKPRMDRVRELVDQLQEHQRQVLSERRFDAARSQREALLTLVTATAVSLLLVLLIFWLLRYTNGIRERLTLGLQRANEELESKVRERTATLSHYANELGRSNRELQDFAFVASHDLQEPLRKIRAFGNRLQQKYSKNLGEQGVDYTNRMQAAAERMSRLINDLLAFSRVSTKGRPFEETSLNEVIDGVLDDLEVAIEESGAQIQVAQLPVIEADAMQMRQLFQNLLGNALKFHHEGVTPQITVDCRLHETADVGDEQVDNVCEITVSDNGIGFDQQFMERIFTPFQRLHGRDQYAGTGIGLAVCRRIVERHGGSITAESRPGEGAMFTIKLPTQHVSKSIHEVDDYVQES